MTIDQMIEKQKADKLISLGYYEKEYGSEIDDADHPFLDKEVKKYYRKVPLPVTDEQFEQIVKIGTARTSEPGTLPKVMKWIGVIIYALSFFVGMFSARNGYSYDFVLMLAWWFGGFLFGTAFIWMGAVLKELRTR